MLLVLGILSFWAFLLILIIFDGRPLINPDINYRLLYPYWPVRFDMENLIRTKYEKQAALRDYMREDSNDTIPKINALTEPRAEYTKTRFTTGGPL